MSGNSRSCSLLHPVFEPTPDSLKRKSKIAVEHILTYVLERSPEAPTILKFYGNLSIIEMTNSNILAELCWIVYSSGFRYDIVKKYWGSLKEAFRQFDVVEVASLYENMNTEAKRICSDSGFRNLRKATWCIQNAKRIIELDYEKKHLGGLKGYFLAISKRNHFELVQLAPSLVQELRFRGIGNTTIFHLMKNVGIDIFKPDIHVRRILTGLGLIDDEYSSAIEICRSMLFLSSLTGIRVAELDTLLFLYGRMTDDRILPEALDPIEIGCGAEREGKCYLNMYLNKCDSTSK